MGNLGWSGHSRAYGDANGHITTIPASMSHLKPQAQHHPVSLKSLHQKYIQSIVNH